VIQRFFAFRGITAQICVDQHMGSGHGMVELLVYAAEKLA
jgi:hypothetical protein